MLEIHFRRDGSVTMTPTGYPGQECRQVTEYFASYMGGRATSDVPTDEAHDPNEKGYVAAPKHVEKQ